MQIRQIQVARDALQDRLTLRISSQAMKNFGSGSPGAFCASCGRI